MTEENLSKIDPCKLLWSFQNTAPREPGESPFMFAKPPEPKLLENRLKKDIRRPRGDREKYGLSLSGYNNCHTINEIPKAYQTLLEEGFKPENVYILDNNFPTNFFCPTDDVATKKSLSMITDYFIQRMQDEDALFCLFAGHGSRRDFLPDYAIPLWGSDPKDHDLLLASGVEHYLDRIAASIKVLVFCHCFGGVFASRFNKDNYIAVSASNGSRPSYGSYFTKNFFGAICEKYGDFDNDGRVSIGEAFWYAVLNDPCTKKGWQEPQIFYGDINPMTTYLDR
ncbi:MAG: hypothetical protein ACP5E4_03190 [Candidatus Aenigmatarchaeota archaeon]